MRVPGISRLLAGIGLSFSLLLASTPSQAADDLPSVTQWVQSFEHVRRHALFRDLDVSYAKASARNTGYTPVGVVQGEAPGCKVVIAEGENPKMREIMRYAPTPARLQILMTMAAAHELGHCLRVRQARASSQLWALVAASRDGSPERQSLERQASREEAYADAYALVYLRDAHPELYGVGLAQLKALRGASEFATPFYQVQPLYEALQQRDLDTRLPLLAQAEDLVQRARFPAD